LSRDSKLVMLKRETLQFFGLLSLLVGVAFVIQPDRFAPLPYLNLAANQIPILGFFLFVLGIVPMSLKTSLEL